jgi:hypothetical protein
LGVLDYQIEFTVNRVQWFQLKGCFGPIEVFGIVRLAEIDLDQQPLLYPHDHIPCHLADFKNMGNLFTTFTNCRLCINGKIVEGERLVVSQDDGQILESTGYIGGEIVDLDDAIIAPGFLELHTNGANGFHYTNSASDTEYEAQLKNVASFYPSHGVTGFWATVPTIEPALYDKVGE